MRKKLSLLLAVAACVASMSMPVLAGNVYGVDVQAGDVYSPAGIKDDNDDHYYFRPTSYVGTAYGISIPYLTYADAYPYRPLRNTQGTTDYRYGIAVQSGNMYWLKTYGTTNGWRVQGVYCP